MTARAALLAIAVTSTAARADVPAVALSWTRLPGAEACIDAPGVARAVEDKIGQVLVTPARASRSVEGRIAPRRGGGWEAVLAVAGPDGRITSRRTLETTNADCRALDAPVALVIALLVDPDGRAAPSRPDVVIREVIVRESWRFAANIRGDLETGLFANAAPMATLGLVFDLPRLPRIELAGSVALARDASTALPGRTVAQSFVGVSAAACPALPFARGRARGFVCGGARLGRLAWSGAGFEQNLDGAALVPALTLDARGVLDLAGPISAVAALGVRVALREVVLRYQQPLLDDDAMTITRTGRFALWLGLGLEIAF